LQLDLDLALDEDDREGHLVVKTLENSKLHRGPVVEAMVAGSSNVTLTSSLGALPASGRAQGIVTVTVDSDVAGSIVPSQTVRLDGVTEEYYAEVIGLGFGAGQDTEFRGRLFVGSRTELPANTQMQIVFRFLGRTAGTVPGDTFSLTYRRVPAPSTLLTPAALPLVDTLGTLDTAVTLTSADQYFEAVSDAFDVAAGDVIMFTLRRDGEDSYSGDLLLLEHHGALINGT
jgi:hypothetical protein